MTHAVQTRTPASPRCRPWTCCRSLPQVQGASNCIAWDDAAFGWVLSRRGWTCLMCMGILLQALHAVQKPALGFHGREEHAGLSHALLALVAGPACSQSCPIHNCQQHLCNQPLSAARPVLALKSWVVGTSSRLLIAICVMTCLFCREALISKLMDWPTPMFSLAIVENILQILRLVETIFNTTTAGLTYLDRAQMWTVGLGK